MSIKCRQSPFRMLMCTHCALQILSEDGAVLACALNAACAALVDAAIPLQTSFGKVFGEVQYCVWLGYESPEELTENLVVTA